MSWDSTKNLFYGPLFICKKRGNTQLFNNISRLQQDLRKSRKGRKVGMERGKMLKDYKTLRFEFRETCNRQPYLFLLHLSRFVWFAKSISNDRIKLNQKIKLLNHLIEILKNHFDFNLNDCIRIATDECSNLISMIRLQHYEV